MPIGKVRYLGGVYHEAFEIGKTYDLMEVLTDGTYVVYSPMEDDTFCGKSDEFERLS